MEHGRTKIVAGERYSDWELIGRGGTAKVFKATDHELGCAVAIKLLDEKFQTNPALLRGLCDEVLISRALRHPNICPIHDIYEGARGFGVVMDYVQGRNLRSWMDENGSRLLQTASERLTLLRTITAALDVAHSRIVHRDLKPSNIYLVGNEIENPMIMDFGVSLLGNGREGEAFAGTPKYASPEQHEAPASVDRRSDLFSLGILAYELMTGGRIPPCSLLNVQSGGVPQLAVSDIPPPSHYCAAIPASLDRIILHMLEYDREYRPASAREIADVLGQCELRAPDSGVGRNFLGKPATVLFYGGDDHGYCVGAGPDSDNAAEKPMRRVVLTPFEISLSPVTNREYREFVERTGNPSPPWIDHPEFGADDHPIVGINWHEAVAYADWVGGRLPTEIEWECAAKAGEKVLQYPWGDDLPGATRANIDGLSLTTTPVHSYINGRNKLGLWDVCGNVWEWCADSWDKNFYRSFRNGTVDPVNDTDSNLRSIRGGSYESFATMGRCSFRHFASADDVRPDIGMRIVYGVGNE
jgi:serine/threonine protein kinase